MSASTWSSSHCDHFEQIHQQLQAQGHDLLQHFDFVAAEGDYRNSKPAPDPYLAGLDQIGLSADECLVIENSPRGLRAASAAGLRCIVIRNAFCRKYDFPGSSYVIEHNENLGELLSHLSANSNDYV